MNFRVVKFQSRLLGSALVFFLLPVLTGCLGRIDDRGGPQVRLRPAAFGLTGERPAVVVFSAVWCKPCRHEIPAFNQLRAKFDDRLEIAGFMVEGLKPGSDPAAEDLRQFADGNGVRPEYPLQKDRGWRLFDSLAPANGRALPFTIFLTREGEIYARVQRSLEFTSEMSPLAEALLRGDRRNSPDSPTPPSEEPGSNQGGGARPQWVPVSEWVKGDAHRPGSDLYQSVYAGWEFGTTMQGFSTEEMPFANGALKVTDSYRVLSGEWRSDSGCKLTVSFNPDGSVAGTTGVCSGG